jgi:hypothetical protein
MSSNGISGLPDLDFMASGMYPGSQQDQTQYAAPAQLPAGAQAVAMQSEYEAKTNPVTGEPMAHFNNGGIAALRYDDGGDVQQPQAPAYSNDDKGNLVDTNGKIVATVEARNDPYIQSTYFNPNSAVASDPAEAQALYDLKSKDPKQYYSQVADKLGSQIINSYQGNQNYDTEYNQLQSLKDVAPQDYYRNQLGFKAHSMGWQVGQNTGDRNAPTQQEIQGMIPEAQKAGLSSDQINSIVNTNFGQARNKNVQRIATLAETGGSGFSFQKDLQPILQNVGIAALTAGAAGALAPAAGIGAGAAEAGAAAGSELAGAGSTVADAGLGLSDLQNAYKAYGLGKNILGVASSGGKNIGADIGAARGIYGLGSTMMAAKGGIAHSADGVASLGSYSDGGQLLKGPGDGMSDHIPATIGGKQPARLADGEFVIPADVVSHLGNGSTDAGAKHLYKMMDKIRKARTGNPKQGKQINASKFLPRN